MALVDIEDILNATEPQVTSDDPAEIRRLIKDRIRQKYGSFWIIILAPIIGELVRMMIERWRAKRSSSPAS